MSKNQYVLSGEMVSPVHICVEAESPERAIEQVKYGNSDDSCVMD